MLKFQPSSEVPEPCHTHFLEYDFILSASSSTSRHDECLTGRTAVPGLGFDLTRGICPSRTLVNTISNKTQIRDTSYPTLQDIVLVNKRCYLATAPVLYREFIFWVSSRERLQKYCAWMGVGRSNYTRCIKVYGHMPPIIDGKRVLRNSQDYFNETFSTNHSDGPAEEVAKSWEPLAMMIENNFQCISDFEWCCDNQFPPCLLNALEQHRPSCRLHIRQFSFHTLHVPEETAGSIEVENGDGDDDGEAFEIEDVYEQKLIQSPLLHSIELQTSEINNNYSVIFHVLSVAPNLRHLEIRSRQPYDRWYARPPHSPWKISKRDLSSDANRPQRKLASLKFVGSFRFTERQIRISVL